MNTTGPEASDSILEALKKKTIIAIIRGARPADVAAIVQALYTGGITAVEITLNSLNAFELIEQLAALYKGSMRVGAGTVMDAASANAAIAAGAQFIISPCFDAATIRAARDKGAVSIPGAYTATEIVQAHRAGADIVKVFPAQSPQYIKDLRGPLSHIPLMPTGGVNLQNIAAFSGAGAVAFGAGSALVSSSETVNPVYLAALTEKARAFVQAVAVE